LWKKSIKFINYCIWILMKYLHIIEQCNTVIRQGNIVVSSVGDTRRSHSQNSTFFTEERRYRKSSKFIMLHTFLINIYGKTNQYFSIFKQDWFIITLFSIKRMYLHFTHERQIFVHISILTRIIVIYLVCLLVYSDIYNNLL